LNWFLKILLFPVSVLFGIIVRIRLWLYEHHFLGSTDFDLPVICVGNLSVGGSGKTPMIEYLTELFRDKYPVGIISRGYARKTTGFLRVGMQHSAAEVGDEPLLLKLKHRYAEVAVGEARVIAIPRLIADVPHLKVLLMDDGFQHLSVRPHVNILLTNYHLPYWKDNLLPVGTLREFPSSAKRANIIVVTKCPADLSQQEKLEILKKIDPEPNQKVFFSGLRYGQPYLLFGGNSVLGEKEHLITITGIADPGLFLEYLAGTHEYIHFEFGDHHPYTIEHLQRIAKNYIDQKKWITTEKDAVRLLPFRNWFLEKNIELWIQPVAVEFLNSPDGSFPELMRSYLSYYYPEPDTETPGNL
jgi:tetraacyldisaccharide 4'-kinase